MAIESTTTTSKTVSDLLDEKLTKEHKTFQAMFIMLTQQIHSHQQNNFCLGVCPSTQAKNHTATPTKPTTDIGKTRHNRNLRNNHPTKNEKKHLQKQHQQIYQCPQNQARKRLSSK